MWRFLPKLSARHRRTALCQSIEGTNGVASQAVASLISRWWRFVVSFNSQYKGSRNDRSKRGGNMLRDFVSRIYLPRKLCVLRLAIFVALRELLYWGAKRRTGETSASTRQDQAAGLHRDGDRWQSQDSQFSWLG